MRLNPKEILFGQPILKIREVIRFAIREQLYGQTEQQVIMQVAKALKQSFSIAEVIFESLIKEGYLTITNDGHHDSTYYKVRTTEKGQRLGITRANPPITRTKADQLLKELIQRVELINDRNDLMFKVSLLKVFGSYLSEKRLLGDVDVAYSLIATFKSGEFRDKYHARVEIAMNKGRRFSSSYQMVSWPLREVELMLVTKKKGLSLHNMSEDEVAKTAVGLIIYEYSPKEK